MLDVLFGHCDLVERITAESLLYHFPIESERHLIRHQPNLTLSNRCPKLVGNEYDKGIQ